MSRPATKAVETWECPKCSYFYHSPIRLHSIEHPCGSLLNLQRVDRVRRQK